MIGHAGMNAYAFLREEDALAQLTALKVAQRMIELRDRRDDQMAIRIANRVGEMLGG